MGKVSVVISAFNEEKKIKACLESAKWADEIIVVDNSSYDKTADIAKKFTKRVYIQKNDPEKIDLQKNFGIQKATGDWIFILDADEIITPELESEIRQVISNDSVAGFWVPRKNMIFNKWIQHSGWYPDYQLRLFRQGKGKYESQHYHEPLTVSGTTEKLTAHLVHHNYESVAQFLHKNLETYAPNEADELLRKGYSFHYLDVIRFPLKEFISRYFARQGYKDGLHGLVLSLLMAVYHFVIFLYLWEKKSFIEVSSEEVDKGLGQLVEKTKKEFEYWLHDKKIENEKNDVKKFFLKLERKLDL